MGKIHILNETVANQIAAGEVVERPASVVKELVENAIDAGATHITIEIQGGGLEKIRVVDDGSGMDATDAQKAFLRHATSKIRSMDDLSRIATMGFRGEALSSIASVSKLNLKTRAKDSQVVSGVELQMHSGGLKSQNPVGMPPGSEVRVEDLFYNVPARRKFIKSARTEFLHIWQQVQNAALAHPLISFKLLNNNKRVLDVGPGQDLSTRTKLLLGEDLFSNLQSVSLTHPYLNIAGWAGKPGASQNSKHQYIFVNQRRVENKTVTAAIRQGYGSILGRGEYPFFVVFLQVPPHLVDVNVHPRKSEVKFVSDGTTFNLIRQAVQQSLYQEGRTYETGMADTPAVTPSDWWSVLPSKPSPFTPSRLPDALTPRLYDTTTPRLYDSPTPQPPILQVNRLYLVQENPAGGLNLYDQHAVHERILYEKFVQKFKAAKEAGDSQQLLIPLTLKLGGTDFDLLMQNAATLGKIGFSLEQAGKNTAVLTAVPTALQDKDPVRIIQDFLSDLSESPTQIDSPDSLDSQTHKTLSYLACRSAIKAGDTLSATQAQALLDQLAQTRTNYTCPHGRPVKATLTEKEIAKLFRRS